MNRTKTQHVVVISHIYLCGDDDHVSAILGAHFTGIEHVVGDQGGVLVGGETRIIPCGDEHPLTVAHREGFSDGYQRRDSLPSPRSEGESDDSFRS